MPRHKSVNEVEEIQEEPVIVPEVKPKLLKVQAELGYSNGTLGQSWKSGEVKEITFDLLIRLRNDLPYNWTVLGG